MLQLKESFEKINYLIRPSKQVERKLFIEALHSLSKIGYNISEYTYLGLGSVFYADFILFHKYLYINDMICAESSKIPKRMRFNKPYRFIKLKMMPVSDVLPSLRRNKRYLVWLDYDCVLNQEILNDIDGFASSLAPGSILIITIEAEPELPDPIENEHLSKEDRENRLIELYEQEFDKHLPWPPRRSDFSKNDLPKLLVQILISQLKTTLVSRSGIEFFQFFNFIYADTAQMLTLGGIIEKDSQNKKIVESGIYNLPYINKCSKPLKISVPPLTIREKQWLDQKIKKGSFSDKLAFELKEQLLKNYIDYYKHYPQYHEALF